MPRVDADLHDSKLHEERSSDGAANPSPAPSVPPPSQDAHPHRGTSVQLNFVVGPNGDIITLADLPAPRTTRWVIRRKAEVVLAVHGGLLSLEDACSRYQLTPEEFFAWQSAIEQHGLLGLRSTHLQNYRHGDKS